MSLPSTYQEVEYIASSGTQYIDTGFKPTNKTLVENKGYLSSGVLFGVGRSGYYQSIALTNTGTYYRGRCRSGSSSNSEVSSSVAIGTTPHTFKISQGDGFYIDGTRIGTFTSYTYTESYNMWVLSWNSQGSLGEGCTGAIYYMKIWDNDVLVRDFIPCYRKSDNEIGLYDLVNDTFYTNSGTGTFTKGPNVVIPYKLHGAIQTFHYKGYNWRDDYQEVKFIQSTATNPGTYTSSGQYIDTLYTPTPNTKIEIDLGFTNTTVQSRLFGVQTEDSSYMTFNAYLNGNGYFARAMIDGTGNWVATTIASDTNRHTFVLDKTGYKIYTNGTQVYSAGNDATPTKNCNHTLPLLANYIFTDSGTTYNKICRHSSAKLYSCKLRESGTLVRDFIPCYKRSNGEIGLYDLVGGKFYANAGTGTFTKGPGTYEGEIIATENTLFLLRNNGDIKDYSSYNHNMSWYGTESYETLNNGRKVAKGTGSNGVYSDYQFDCNGHTTFTLNIWYKGTSTIPSAENTIGGWMMRNGTGSDRGGAKFQALSNSSKQCIIYGPNYSDWIRNDNIGVSSSTSTFKLFTVTINGSTVIVYGDGVQVGTWTGSYPIQGGTSIGTVFYYLGIGGYVESGTTPTNVLPGYWGEIILEDRVRTATEISDYYNAFKSDYIELTLKSPSEIAALITTGDFGQTDFSAALAELNAHPKNYYRQFLGDNNLYTSYGKSNVMGNGNGSAYTKSAQIKTTTYTVVLRYNESTELWETYRYGGGNPSFNV